MLPPKYCHSRSEASHGAERALQCSSNVSLASLDNAPVQPAPNLTVENIVYDGARLTYAWECAVADYCVPCAFDLDVFHLETS